MLMPLVVAAGSLERMAANTSPDVARFRFTIANATTANTTATMAYISSRSVMPMPERPRDLHAGAEVLVLVAGPHELLDEQREADGEQREVEVADPQARQRDQQAERHREHRADEDRQPHRPAGLRGERGRAANAPMPARVIWQSEIRPPSPVTSVYER